jgi:hypothetical protein
MEIPFCDIDHDDLVDCSELFVSIFKEPPCKTTGSDPGGLQKQGDTKGVKDFISVLMLYKDHDAHEVERAIEKALGANTGSSDAVKHILLDTDEQAIQSLDSWQRFSPPDVSVYQQIGGAI